MKKRSATKKVLIGIGCVIGAIAIALIAYVAYVMSSYYRLDDRIVLSEEPPLDGNALLPLEPVASEDASEAPLSTELTIVASNVGFGAYGPDFDFFMDGGTGSVAPNAEYVTKNINGTAEAIATLDPAFILFQEVDVAGTRSCFVDEYELLREDFPTFASVFIQNYDSPYLAWPLYAPHGANRAGLVTLSRFQIDKTLRRSLPISEGFSKFLDLDRCYAISRIPIADGSELVIFNVHLSAYGADESIMQGQREMLFEDMRAELAAGNYVIAGGDFNHDMIGISNKLFGNTTNTEASWAKPFDFQSVPEGFTIAARAEIDNGTFDSAATCRDAGRPYDGTNDRWVMDAFIYSNNITCKEQRTLDLDFSYSDHNPIYMTFALGATNDGSE